MIPGGRIRGLGWALLALTLNSVPATATGQSLLLPGRAAIPGDARRGALIFRDRGCIVCHSVRGEGGTTAPDLVRRSIREYTPELLAGAMWSHAPAMWQVMARRGIGIPALDEQEVADLYAHFFSIRYFDPPGEVSRSKTVFTAKRCNRCHALRGNQLRGEKENRRRAVRLVGPALADAKCLSDPIAWVREMWNHSASMFQKMQEAGIAWPKLTTQEMVDLLLYLQTLPENRSARSSFAPADPEQGQAIFEQKGCGNCHTVSAREKGKINLLEKGRPSGSITEFATEMWNHTPEMLRRAKVTGTPLPKFSGDEMNHLIAYLFWAGFFEQRGNAGRGRRVFVRNKCASCHEQEPAAAAPNLAQFRQRVSPIFMTAALWKHGPRMLKEMELKGYPWPRFAGPDMSDLIAYLNQYARVAQSGESRQGLSAPKRPAFPGALEQKFGGRDVFR